MKLSRILLITAAIITLLFFLFNTVESSADPKIELEIIPINRTDGSVDFQVRTTSYNGAYAPAHCLAIWVCDEEDNFIRTLVRRAEPYIQHLIKWNEMTSGDDTNAIITGASPTVHTTWTINWDCLDRFGEMVPDGNYRVYVEFTEDNSALIPANGPWTMVDFTKGSEPQTVSPAGNQYFQDLYLDYIPSGQEVTDVHIISPEEGDVISELPIAIHFELEFFTPDSGSINLFINDEFIHEHVGESAIPIYALPEGEVELAVKLFDNECQPFDPPAEDSVNITYSPTSVQEDNVNSIISQLSSYPNPFNPSTRIQFTIKSASNIELEVLNSRGQLVKSLIRDRFDAGTHSVIWDGSDSSDSPVASGVYFYRLRTDYGEETRKCTLLK